MPWVIKENHPDCPSSKPYAVVKESDNSVSGCHASKEEAQAQMDALYASENDSSAESLQNEMVVGNYAMVALIPSPEVAAELAIEGGEDPAVLHVTIIYLGPEATAQLDRSAVAKTVGIVASEFGPVSGVYNGMCRFGLTDDGNPIAGAEKIPLVTTLDAPGLDVLRVALASALRADGIDYPPDTHGWLPHTTVMYCDPNDIPNPFPEPSMLEVTYSDVCVCWGDYVGKPENLTRFPLRGEENPTAKPLEDMQKPTTASATLHSWNVPGGVVTFTSTATNGTVLAPEPVATPAPTADPQTPTTMLEPEWEALVVFEDVPTDDGRLPFDLKFRDPPFAAEWTDEEPIIGHAKAKRFGTVLSAERRNGNEVWLSGVYIDSETAKEVRRLADQDEQVAAAGWPSVQVSGPESSEPEELIEIAPNGDMTVRFTGTLVGFALVPIQAQSGTMFRNLKPAGEAPLEPAEAIAASIPVAPPADWFEDPKFEKPTPLTVTDEGRVFGHFGRWDGPDSCYTGRQGCTRPPRAEDLSYSRFRCGHVMTTEGSKIPTGSIVLTGGHRDLYEIARGHADTRTGVADVVVGEDKFGPWVAGALRPGTSPEEIRVMRASPLSGEWYGSELLGITCVNRPGFLVRALAASAGDVKALIAVGPSQEGMMELEDTTDPMQEVAEETDPLRIAQDALELLASPDAIDGSGTIVDPMAELAARIALAAEALKQMGPAGEEPADEPPDVPADATMSAEQIHTSKNNERAMALAAAALDQRVLGDYDQRVLASLDERVG